MGLQRQDWQYRQRRQPPCQQGEWQPAYLLELFQRVITVSLRTMEIVRGLPKLEVKE